MRTATKKAPVRKKPQKPRDMPLVDHCEGADADDRASLRAAWKRLQYSRKQRQVTDLHVREFVFWIWAKDVRKEGYQATYEEIAKELECKICTARKVVARASKDYGLVELIEQRYATGSQAANRYSIDLSIVRSINRGLIEPSRPVKSPIASGSTDAVSSQGPATTSQGPATTSHHNKELPRLLPRLSPSSSNLLECDTRTEATWEEAEAVMTRLPQGRRPIAWMQAIRAARANGVSAGHVIATIEHYQAHASAYEGGALFRRLQRSHPDVPPSEDWADPSPSVAGPPDPTPAAIAIRNADRVRTIETLTIRDGRSKGQSDVTIRGRIDAELVRAGFDPALSDWGREAKGIDSNGR